ncbi:MULTISPECIES: alpha/beta hydrolase [unclassified Bradyrhizobium]|jgi:pimeloyl-ACP methyl ester carboxylesterase|uniref:alpha/beta fold hydrolase n=1 Tax=unclassified Bradyrhizobium TaxID=2631580 RepID=UPI00205730DE|nr:MULTISPECIES: alpha/beta hydrolase [unclassified Bradyrhizobium]MCK1306052.1 alpha/beta hydrolase [Bradyrhizobium sp. 45]MCK1322343.1 alpha/beta hydrolase [Bradyrhizobium sp. 156]MCK1453358.1 alpha/beta hydrolase [Bradyrhizobium sp. 35]MCK1497049.1 alpha/beta hydrolase [Bradyrhizobium sp. 188]MCK1533005.1 alpha/beta hydrolase [Bradyrhizobium sp. 176]
MIRLLPAVLCTALLAAPLTSHAANTAPREPYGIALEGFAYPYPVHLLPLINDSEQLSMAYMDVPPAQPNGRTVVLLHGRNFPSSYWAPVIKMLSEAGYRVVVPDQIGFGKSSKPTGELHFDTLARNTIALLDHLKIDKAEIVAHSLGGMLGVRIARAFPDRVAHLVLTAPIGLEDYRLYVPPTPTEKMIETEDKLTADGYRKQLQTNYAIKLPAEAITPFIDARFNIKGSPDYPRWLRAFVSSGQMIYREPVAHEIALITEPTLFIMGADDHNAPGRPNAPEALRAKMGENAELAKALAAKMPNAQAEVIPDTGHLVFLEAPEKYRELVLGFLGR